MWNWSFLKTLICAQSPGNSPDIPECPPIRGLEGSRKVQNSRLAARKKLPRLFWPRTGGKDRRPGLRCSAGRLENFPIAACDARLAALRRYRGKWARRFRYHPIRGSAVRMCTRGCYDPTGRSCPTRHVRSGLQVVEDVDAVFVGSDLAADAGGGVERDYGRRGNGGAGCVCYISG